MIAMIFSILIVSPISSIGIGLAIGISGLAAGSAAVGVAASAIMLAVGSWRVNKPGVPITVLLSSKINDADADSSSNDDATHCLYCRCVTGFVGGLFNIKGTPDSAGFDSLVLLDRLNR